MVVIDYAHQRFIYRVKTLALKSNKSGLGLYNHCFNTEGMCVVCLHSLIKFKLYFLKGFNWTG